MKIKLTLLSLSSLLFFLYGCDPVDNSQADDLAKQQDTVETAEDAEIIYNAEKAERYGADEYGMRTYIMALLKTGPNRPEDSLKSVALMRGHLDNIGRLAKEGKLVVSGPFFGNQDLKGIYIFNTDNLDSAKAMTKSDPAIKFGSLEMELLKWYGSAALMEVNEIHSSLSKSEI